MERKEKKKRKQHDKTSTYDINKTKYETNNEIYITVSSIHMRNTHKLFTQSHERESETI